MENLYYQKPGRNAESKTTEQVAATPVVTPVVLLHGLFGMSDNLLGLAKALSAGYEVILPDLINHGQSPKRVVTGYPQMAGEVIRLMDSLHIERAHLVGHSMGGKVAMQMATSFPDRVRSLVVADIAPVAYPEKHREIIRAMQEIASATIHSRRQADTILAGVVGEEALRQFFLKSLERKEDGSWGWCYGLDEIENGYRQICAAPVFSKPFNNPVLFIKGGASDYVREEYRSEVLHFFPHARMKEIPDAGHWLHAEKPLVFNQMVRRFLQEQD